MKVEIWSDVVCPFCYIGKRKFEQALALFEHRQHVEIQWKSFQLDPGTVTTPGMSVAEHLAERKGISENQARKMQQQVTQAAAEVGLQFNFDKAVVANTLRAHQLSSMAAKLGVQDKIEELLFKAYFEEGKNIDDLPTLTKIGLAAGIDTETVTKSLGDGSLLAEVREHIAEAEELGIRGVPFFVFDQKFAISGAQPAEAFLDALQQSWKATN